MRTFVLAALVSLGGSNVFAYCGKITSIERTALIKDAFPHIVVVAAPGATVANTLRVKDQADLTVLASAAGSTKETKICFEGVSEKFGSAADPATYDSFVIDYK